MSKIELCGFTVSFGVFLPKNKHEKFTRLRCLMSWHNLHTKQPTNNFGTALPREQLAKPSALFLSLRDLKVKGSGYSKANWSTSALGPPIGHT